jgi:hypothetical protein
MDELNNNLGELQSNQKGISNTTIAVLVILALLISIIGTWAVLNSIATQQAAQSNGGTNTNTAIVSLNIKNPDVKTATGRITLELV